MDKEEIRNRLLMESKSPLPHRSGFSDGHDSFCSCIKQ